MDTPKLAAATFTLDGEIGAGTVGFTLSPLRASRAAEGRTITRCGSPAAHLKARSG